MSAFDTVMWIVVGNMCGFTLLALVKLWWRNRQTENGKAVLATLLTILFLVSTTYACSLLDSNLKLHDLLIIFVVVQWTWIFAVWSITWIRSWE